MVSGLSCKRVLETKEETKGEAHVIRKPSQRHGREQRAGKMKVSIAWELAREGDVISHFPFPQIFVQSYQKWIRWKAVD